MIKTQEELVAELKRRPVLRECGTCGGGGVRTPAPTAIDATTGDSRQGSADCKCIDCEGYGFVAECGACEGQPTRFDPVCGLCNGTGIVPADPWVDVAPTERLSMFEAALAALADMKQTYGEITREDVTAWLRARVRGVRLAPCPAHGFVSHDKCSACPRVQAIRAECKRLGLEAWEVSGGE